MKETHSLKEKYKQFLMILIPIFVTQIGIYSMNFFDTMMSGRYSSSDLAGVAIGSSIWVPIYTGLGGILLSITPITAQFLGAKNAKEVTFTIIQGVYIAIALGISIIIVGSFALDPILNGMNLEPGTDGSRKIFDRPFFRNHSALCLQCTPQFYRFSRENKGLHGDYAACAAH